MLLYLFGCDDFVLFNDPPEVRFLAPESGAVVSRALTTEFLAEVTDDVDGLDNLTFQFALEDGTLISGQTAIDPDEHTVLFATSAIPDGNQVLTLRATDRSGETGRGTLAISVFDNIAPYIEFTSPTPGQVFLAGTPVPVQGTLVDPDALDAAAVVTLAWEGAAASVEAAPSSLSLTTPVDFVITGLAVADWTLGVSVSDTLGGTGKSSLQFGVVTGDLDMDGHSDVVYGGDDCNDADADIYPGATEHCDGIDEDCSGTADDNPVNGSTWYTDSDGDGFGDPNDDIEACEAVSGRVSTGTDCDDHDADAYPGSVEVCGNNRDDDCNSVIDQDAADFYEVYADGDGDGYGSGGWFESCGVDSGESLVSGDCDDADAAINPDADELCDAFDVDEDCDTLSDDADTTAIGKGTYYADNDRDGYGDAATPDARCDAADNWVADRNDCDDTSAMAYTGASEVCEDSVDNDCVGGDAGCVLAGGMSLSDADVKLTGPGSLAFAGNSLALASDANGDGAGELLVGAWAYGGLGAVYVVPGGALASGSLGAYPTISGDSNGQYFGWAVSGCGDADGDGASDFVASDLDWSDGAGAVFRFATAGSYADAGSADGVVFANLVDSALGSSIACGADLDGDLVPELLASAPGLSSVYVVNASTMGTENIISDVASGGQVSVATLSDVDGDGMADFVVGEASGNTVYVVRGGNSGLATFADADFVLSGENSEDSAGYAVSSAGDVDGDGLGDVLLGAPESDSPDLAAGAAYLVLGDSLVSESLVFADAIYRGESASDRAGYTVALAGDADGDGFDDLLIGAYCDDYAGTLAGAAFLFYGAATPVSGSAATPDAAFYGEGTGDGASEGLAGGDVNGDGFGDVLVGAPTDDAGGSAAGAAYVIFGGGS